jgi:hypothetical protein
VTFPRSWDTILSPLTTAVYVTAPIWALYEASREIWTWKRALLLIAIGIAIHLLVLLPVHPPRSLLQYAGARAVAGIAQAGLLTWCLGLGALLASLLRDRNLILPVALFLAAFDIFVILTPGGPTRMFMTNHPEVFARIAYAVPRPTYSGPELGSGITGRIGPADMFVLAMFFVALGRFGMRAAATFRAVAPALILYLFVVIVFGSMRIGPIRLDALPALVPIGAVVLFINRKEFSLTRDEKLSTGLVALLGLGLIIFGATRHRGDGPPSGRVEPLPRERGRGRVGRATRPGQGAADPPRFEVPTARTSTPNPP